MDNFKEQKLAYIVFLSLKYLFYKMSFSEMSQHPIQDLNTDLFIGPEHLPIYRT